MANKSEDHRVRDCRDKALREQQQQLGLKIERTILRYFVSDDVFADWEGARADRERPR
jgi:hypothetical protein